MEVSFNPNRIVAPIVVISPKGFISGQWSQSDVSQSGFKIKLSEPQLSEAGFTWQALTVQ